VQETQPETWQISTEHRGEKNFPKDWLSTGAGHLAVIQSSTSPGLRQADLTSEFALL